jgi:hypothetical protein
MSGNFGRRLAPFALRALPPNGQDRQEEHLASQFRGSEADPSPATRVAGTSPAAGSRLAREEVKIFDPLGGHAKKILHVPEWVRGRRSGQFWAILPRNR